MVIYDFEVFKYDWLVVIADAWEHEVHVIVNDPDKLQKIYDRYKKRIWVGYNSRNYDKYILQAILCGFNPKEINDFIIVEDQKGWAFSSALRKIPLRNYDVIPNPPIGLKTMEGFMGNDIKETDVPFDIDRKLTEEEIKQTVKYCTHDVEQTMEVFLHRKEEFNSQMALINTFKLPLTFLDKTEAQITAEILECSYCKWTDEWDLFMLDTIRLDKYKFVADWFLDPKNQSYKDKDDKKNQLTVEVCGVPHTFGWGGLHGARKKYHAKGLLLHVDVTSYYPSLLILYKLMSRASKNPGKYKEIYNQRVALKRQGKKKEQAPYKKVLNAASGAMKDKYNKLYDPRNNNLMCVNGQLMLLDLLERLEGHCTLIQSNTDGLIIEIPDTDQAFEIIDDICFEWEQRTGMGLGLDVIREIYQKDVNNYLWIDENGGLERIGAYVKELSPIDNDLPIINEALVNYMVNGIPVEDTIMKCDELIRFQKLVKLSYKYEHVQHNGKKYTYKCYRVFASKRSSDGKIYKCREGCNPAKFGGTADHCFINNDDIKGLCVPRKLDKQWYVDLAKERLRQFGALGVKQ